MERTDKEIIENQRRFIIKEKEFTDKLNKKLKTWLISFLILLIITMIISLWYMFGGAGKCQDDPFKYGANLISKKTDGDIKCDCSFYDKDYKIKLFSFENKDFNPRFDLSLINRSENAPRILFQT